MISKTIKTVIFLSLLVFGNPCQAKENSAVIASGIPWYDNNGDIVNAHGACIVEDGGKYYLFGEWKSDKSNAFPGFSCYSSTDLVNWKFERVVLPMQKDGIMGPDRVGERVKVMKCPKTGKYVMYMHSDNMKYTDPYTAVAVCDKINGEYKMVGPLMFNGKPVKWWDMGSFQDTDGKGYILIHHGPVLELSDDYMSVVREAAHVPDCGESPAMFKKDGLYYLIYSGLTAWEKNDNFYFTAPSIEGPWTKRGLFCPEGTLTYNSQSTFVFPLKVGNDTVPMYMGDRWSYPRQASAATYVWQPLQVNGTEISIPAYNQFWDTKTLRNIEILEGQVPLEDSEYKADNGWKRKNGQWKSNIKGSELRIAYDGTRMAIKGLSQSKGCYARVSILDAKNDTVYSSLVDFYSKYPEESIRIITPEFKKGAYALVINNTGDMPVWDDKSNRLYGSTGTEISITDIYPINEELRPKPVYEDTDIALDKERSVNIEFECDKPSVTVDFYFDSLPVDNNGGWVNLSFDGGMGIGFNCADAGHNPDWEVDNLRKQIKYSLRFTTNDMKKHNLYLKSANSDLKLKQLTIK